MDNEAQEEFNQAEADLRRLRRDKQLPPLMELKLAYLEALLTDSQTKHDVGQPLQPEERQAIQDLPIETKKRLFIDTVKCLSGRQVIVYCRNERAYLRREGSFFSWEKCYLNCSSNILNLKSKKESKSHLYKFDLQKVCISKHYKKYKGKYVLAIDCEGVKHVIGFEEEITCKRVHEILRELIDQSREWQSTTYDNNKFIEEREAERLALPAHRVKQIIYQEEYQYITSLQQRMKQLDTVSESDFELHKSAAQGRILTTKNGMVKTQVILKGVDAFTAASGYIQMAKWNKAIESCEIVSRPRTNCLIANFKTKKYSMVSYTRGATLAISFFKTCNCSSEVKQTKYSMLIENLPGSEGQNAGLEMSLKQVLHFIPNRQDPSLLLITSITKADFKGFCSQSDNLAMTLHITQQIQSFCQFIQTMSADKDNSSRYFQPVPCPCGLIINDSDDVSLPTERQELLSQYRNSTNGINGLVTPVREKEIIAVMQDICRGLVNQQIIKIVSTRSFQKYYLQHHFSRKDESIEVTKGEVRNFLSQGTRWKIQKQDFIFVDAQVLSAQKDILKMVLKQISACLLQGKSVMNMSLPVEIFDKRSLLDAIPDSYGFLPAYAPRIVAAKDPIQQIKLVSAVFIFVQATDPNIEKPFNPILGQTYQGRLGDFEVYIQQISHHPPISSVLIKNEEMEVYGNIELVIGMGLNSVSSTVMDWLRAKVYSTGTEYLIKATGIELGGLVYGSRTYKMANKGCIFQKKNSLYCQFSIGKDKKRVYQSKPKPKAADLTGGIYKVNQQFCNYILSCKKPTSFEGIKPENILETCCLITGRWYGDLYYNGVCYKSLKEGPFPLRGQKMKYVLPSDSIWRLDITYRVWKDFQNSNREKERLQNLQRNDRKLRQKYKRIK